jgi:ketosteroid isomerase-like protein
MQSWIHVIEWRANVRPDLTALVDDRGAAYTYAQLRAAMYLQVRDGHVTRIEEYLDSAKRSSIRAAREALSG